jgi:hypothetical protein
MVLLDLLNAALCGKFGAQRKICPTAALCYLLLPAFLASANIPSIELDNTFRSCDSSNLSAVYFPLAASAKGSAAPKNGAKAGTIVTASPPPAIKADFMCFALYFPFNISTSF